MPRYAFNLINIRVTRQDYFMVVNSNKFTCDFTRKTLVFDCFNIIKRMIIEYI